MKKIGSLLRMLRKEAGLTQAEFGKRIGVSKQAISNYEADIRMPDYETLEAICDVLNKPMGFFMDKNEQRENVALSLHNEPQAWLDDDGIWKLREALRRSEGMRMLFDATKDATEEDLLRTVEIVNSLKRLSGKADD